VFDLQGSLVGEMLAHEFLGHRGLFYKFNRFLEKLTTQMADVILASSVGAAAYLGEDPDLNTKKVHVVPEGVDVAAYDSVVGHQELRASFGIDPLARLCVYLGLLYPYQGIDSLIRSAPLALEICPNLQFLIIGFPHVDHYRTMASSLGMGHRFRFVGRVRYEELPLYLRAGDLAVTPKDSQTEANSKIYNFMAAGLPVVAYDTATNRSILGDLGVYVPRGDEEHLARAVGELAGNTERLTALGSGVRDKARTQFDWLDVGRKIVSIYDEVSQGRG
jgi:glycosyltransferase involved in cell wall biosynthesis